MKLAAGAILGLGLFAGSASAQTSTISPREQVAEMGRGMNILSSDPYWTDPSHAHFKPQYFAMLKSSGFSNVRIAQAFFAHRSANGNSLDPVFLQRLDWVVNQAIQAGLSVVIDNNNDEKNCDPIGKTCIDMETSIWREVAYHFRNSPPTVMFELYNEPGNGISADWNNNIIEMLTAIRETNPTRNVIIGPPHGYHFQYLPELKLPDYDHHIIVTVHYYDPTNFTNQGASWWSPTNRPPVGTHWGNSGEVARVQTDFNFIAQWAQQARRPIYLGEFGALETADMPDRVAWISTVAKQAELHGFSWSYWQFDKDFVAYDVKDDHWVQPIYEALTNH